MTEQLAHIGLGRARGRLHFVRHLVEMFLAMMVGMPVGRLFFAVAYGSAGDETVRQHPVTWTVVMAIAMTVPMVAWMRYRGHSWRSAGEMAAAMIAPAVPLVGLKVGDLISGPVAGTYMTASTIAMIALIVYRRREYQAAAAAH